MSATLRTSMMRMLSVLVLSGFLASAPALAAKPDSPGNGKGKGSEQVDPPGHAQPGKPQAGKPQGEHGHAGVNAASHFSDNQRGVIREYFGREFSRGSCPPGLAKKHNGCMPPGLAKKWAVGRPLPHDVIYYDLPYALARELGRAPEGHKFVRVAADVLLIAVGTGMVVDAIEDLNNL